MSVLADYSNTEPVRRKPFNRREYHFLADSGLLSDGHYELLDGEILKLMPQKEPHGSIVMALVFLMAQLFGAEYVRCQMPVVLSDDSEPEPDVLVTTQPRSVYQQGTTPPAADVRLLIEVSQSTLDYDTRDKALRYARAGIVEYWVVDLDNRRLLVHRAPTTAGYATPITLTELDSVSPLAAAQATLSVRQLLP